MCLKYLGILLGHRRNTRQKATSEENLHTPVLGNANRSTGNGEMGIVRLQMWCREEDTTAFRVLCNPNLIMRKRHTKPTQDTFYL